MNLFDMLFSSSMIGGGGGGGDQMRTATVSILYDADPLDETYVYAPFVSNDGSVINTYLPLDSGVPAEVDVVLGQQGTVILCAEGTYFSDSLGDVQTRSDKADIFGDCSLTISKGTPK